MRQRFVDLMDTSEDHVLLERFFHDLFTAGFPDPDERESLETLAANLVNRRRGDYGLNNYHIVLLLEGDRPVAGCVADYLADSNCGAVEYLLVDPGLRGKGLGRAIHDRTIELLATDARMAGKAGLAATMVEINDPFQISTQLDNVDPFERVMMWHRWGYQRLRFPYEQPALSASQSPVTYLLLGVKVFDPDLSAGFPSTLARQMVIDYLVWANRFSDFAHDPFFRVMSDYAAAHPVAPVEPLDAYIGQDPSKPLDVRPILDGEDENFRELAAVYRRAFPQGEATLPPDRFLDHLARQRTDGTHYHLWSFAEAPDGKIAGMASFYATPQLGFLGYLVLEPPLKGRGLARVALKRIEARMITDQPGMTHHYLECAPASPQAKIFAALGFRPVPLDYRQPLLDGAVTGAPGPRMVLMRKRLGDPIVEDDLSKEQIRSDIAQILSRIYGLT